MEVNIKEANKTLLELTNNYQNLVCCDITVEVPYFINTAEQVYKQAVRDAGFDNDALDKILKPIKNGETALGSGAGKGSPEQIAKDIKRLIEGIGKSGYHPKTAGIIRSWMTIMHVGIDCSGYVYNVLVAIEKDQNIEILKHLAWANPDFMKPSHAGAFIFDSDELERITDWENLAPLDILIRKDHTHIGLLAELEGNLCVVDCSMGNNGITFSPIQIKDNEIEVIDSDSWTKAFKNKEVTVRRLSF